MDFLLEPTIIASFISLTILEIVLGIDNIIFIALLVQHLPELQQKKARNIGIFLAFILRIAMLFGIVWIIGLKEPFITLFDHDFSGKDLMMLAGGSFLIYKATSGIHEEVSGDLKAEYKKYSGAFFATISQIALIDLVFSFDSIMTAVGMTEHTTIIIAAMTIAMAFMVLAADKISEFIQTYPSLKMLALSFVMLIGLLLSIDAFGVHVPKGYIYAAMAFSLGVETLNIVRGRHNKSRNKKRV
ncbi:MAG: putative tellurium resistance membrane protein TerC [Alphaproteobacteria bacterium]|jgi:predicted tellurium resistance membrane protein TerC